MECSIEEIINDSSNKYVYGESVLEGYKNQKDDPILVVINECELPYVSEDIADDIRIKAFHENYYGILIAIHIIDELINTYIRSKYYNFDSSRKSVIVRINDALKESGNYLINTYKGR